jgi:hypothetical protein
MPNYRAVNPFVYVNRDGDNIVIGTDLILTADHPAVQDKRDCFVELDTADVTDGIVETTRKNPGEKRATKRSQ